MATTPSYVWHTAVHNLRRERLYFWRFAFSSVYSRKQIARAIAEIVESLSPACESYAIYETLGYWDFILRVWVPSLHQPDELEEAIFARLTPLGLTETQYMAVYEILRHHAWRALSLPNPTPQEASIGLSSHSDFVEAIDSYNEELSRVLIARLESGRLVDDWANELNVPKALDLGELMQRGIVAPILLGTEGVRFNISLGLSSQPLSHDARQRVNTGLVDAVNTFTAGFGSSSPASVSIYHGYGTFTSHLMTCRAPDGSFYEFINGLVDRIHSNEIIGLYRLKPSTSVYASRDVLMVRETALAKADTTEFDPRMLTQEESETFEVKASALFDLHRFVRSVNLQPELQQPRDPARYALEKNTVSLGKAVCALLNNGKVGNIVVGLAENNRVREKLNLTDDELAKIMSTALHGVPLVADQDNTSPKYWLIGIEVDYQLEDGRLRITDSDTWARYLSSYLSRKITPDPVIVGDVRIQVLRPKGFERDIAHIVVKPAPDRRWYYFEDIFYVREGANSKPLSSTLADDYKDRRRNTYG